jgi:glycosyltransferase involved in cell wall biosynthesis
MLPREARKVRSASVAKGTMPASGVLVSGEALNRERRARCDVLFVLTHLSPGGTLEIMILIAGELRALGLRVEIVSLYRGTGADVRALDCDVLVDQEQLGIGGYVKAFFKLAKRTRATRPAAVLSFMPVANVLGAISATLSGVRCRIASHHQTRTAQHVAVRIFDWVLGSLGIYRHAVAVSQSVRASFSKYPRAYLERVHVIPNAIRPVSPCADKSTVRKSLCVAPDATLLAVVGRLVAQKNLLTTIAAISRVPDVHIVLVGEGPLRSEIESYIASAGLQRRIILVGQIDHQAALDVLFASDLFVQLSFFEGRSIALLEALAARKAILASDIASQREAMTMDDGRLAGIVVDPADEDAIAAAVATITQDEGLRRELAARAGALAAGLDPAQMGRDYVALLKG